MNNMFSRCIACQSENIHKVRGVFQINMTNKEIKVPNIEYYTCSQCGEQFMDLDNEIKIDAYLKNKHLCASHSNK